MLIIDSIFWEIENIAQELSPFEKVRKLCLGQKIDLTSFFFQFPPHYPSERSEFGVSLPIGCLDVKGSARCSELLPGCNLLMEEGQELYRENNLHEVCNGCIELACSILQKQLAATDDLEESLKGMVRQRYNDLALVSSVKSKCCCNPMAPATPSKKVYTIMSEDYTKLKGYEPDADLGVGCGLPTQYAGIKTSDTVVDLGSGAGNDCFIAREETGKTGRVIGIDFAPNMIAKARANAARRGFTNIEFLEGDIENMPLPDAVADVVVSNCVLNLLPRKFHFVVHDENVSVKLAVAFDTYQMRTIKFKANTNKAVYARRYGVSRHYFFSPIYSEKSHM